MHITDHSPARPLFTGNAETPLWLRALNWLAARDAAYRDAARLRGMSADRLADMGLRRAHGRITGRKA